MVLPAGSQADTERCPAGGAMCLYGTAQTVGYTAAAASMSVRLYRMFPSPPGGVAAAPQPIAAELLAKDGTWAFAADATGRPLDAWAHYYVEVVPRFGAQQAHAVSARVGPLALPGAGSAPIAIQVAPVQIDVLEESGGPGAPLLAKWATAHVFDPASGDEVQGGAGVSIRLGGVATAMPWGPVGASGDAFGVVLASAVPAQPSYDVTVVPPGSTSPSTWTVAASVPVFSASIASPASGAPVHAGQPLAIAWPPQAGADYEIVQLFVQGDGGAWIPTYASPQLDSPDAGGETIPGDALSSAGSYLLNVAFTTSACAPAGAGCVHASQVVGEPLTVE